MRTWLATTKGTWHSAKQGQRKFLGDQQATTSLVVSGRGRHMALHVLDFTVWCLDLGGGARMVFGLWGRTLYGLWIWAG